ncbi:hypothetical protein SAMN04487866_11148 [Thermoactinomyces sp. DSM 45891]|uniref:hypothetical protein n=1 Tax=Thermoactinomyces sp. DSM 45891 TaxID=1761907 RepID=UPI0009217DF7|nr:hypothetical protein [Thermoactinomyces sp. DSM 45891]SFX54718.1 hypothetical protein SAMN04487866_11148 [Thermoactinomyces sp. DSM 45891]
MLNTIGKIVITVFVVMIPYASAISVFIQETAQEHHEETTTVEHPNIPNKSL